MQRPRVGNASLKNAWPKVSYTTWINGVVPGKDNAGNTMTLDLNFEHISRLDTSHIVPPQNTAQTYVWIEEIAL